VLISQKQYKIEIQLQFKTNKKSYVLSIGTSTNDFEWPWRSLACCKFLQMAFFVLFCSSRQDFHWHSVLTPTAVTELLVWTQCDGKFCAFSALKLLVGRQEEHPACKEWWSVGMVFCLERGANSLHMVQLMPSSLASFESRLVLSFWYWLTQVVLEKRPLNGCSSRVVMEYPDGLN